MTPAPAPATTPWAMDVAGLSAWDACRRLASLPHLLFLDSASVSPLGRYSFVTADPFLWVSRTGDADSLLELERHLRAYPLLTRADLPPFQGGLAGLFSYDLARQFERLPQARFDDFRAPDLAVGFYDWTLAFDHHAGHAWLVSTGLPAAPQDRERHATARMDQVLRWLDAPPADQAPPQDRIAIATPQYPVPGVPAITSNFDRRRYLDMIRRGVEYIQAGDCFQVNLAQRLLTPAVTPALELYGRLRTRNAAPFAGYFDAGSLAILSASPERFLRVQDRVVQTRPIKGTRPRGFTPEEDLARADDLQTSEKDVAENVMIVDLLRNDLGRVCRYGSIQVESICRLETYRYVHHLVSEVRGELRADASPLDLLRVAFPGGSITGAPKIRAMEIIAELEATARGPYCGSLGYIGFDGTLDTNLLIRTYVETGGWLHASVGGGIVADSEPAREYEETWHKAEGLLRALV